MSAPALSPCVLMCHAPIVIPEVGGPRGGACQTSTTSMRAVAEHLVAAAPDVLVVVSPHTPRARKSYGLVQGPLEGSMERFGAPETRFSLPVDDGAADALLRAAKGHGVDVDPLALDAVDHGAAVPLQFVVDAGWSGPTLLLAFPYPTSRAQNHALGDAMRDAAQACGQRWALLASGDMSHCLKPGAPSGFHPAGQQFDADFSDAIARGDVDGATRVDPEIREHAAEDVVDSVEVALGACGDAPQNTRMLSYEGPFGVGYCIAILHDDADAS